MNILELEIGDMIPDEKNIGLFREELTQVGFVEDQFDNFKVYLNDKSFDIQRLKNCYASFTEVPLQRNTLNENIQIKEGNGDDLSKDNPPKKCQ